MEATDGFVGDVKALLGKTLVFVRYVPVVPYLEIPSGDAGHLVADSSRSGGPV